MKSRTICVMGSPSVGKSAITQQFVSEKFVEAYAPTIENTFNKDFAFNGSDFALSIVDTAGQDEHSRLTSTMSIVDGYILVCSVNSRQSFDTINVLNDKVLEQANPQIPRLIVLNKTDLPPRQRMVTHEELVALGERLKCPVVECSAKSHEQVANVFKTLLSEIERGSEPPAPKRRGGCNLL